MGYMASLRGRLCFSYLVFIHFSSSGRFVIPPISMSVYDDANAMERKDHVNKERKEEKDAPFCAHSLRMKEYIYLKE